MPEAPEVTHLVKYISKHCQGKTLSSVDIVKGRYHKHGPPANFKDFCKDLPLKLADVQKRGKVIIFYFADGWQIVSKLGLMGFWYVDNDKPHWMKGTHNVEFKFKGVTLYYHDTLSYGTLTFTQDSVRLEKELARLAPEFETVTLPVLLERVASKKRLSEKLIEDVLLDQNAVVSGIGNYLKSEILYQARISPMRQIKTLTETEWKTFLESARKVFKRMINVLGDEDKYMESMRVYMQSVDKLGNKVKKHRTKDNRTTYWVPAVQK